MGKRGWVVGLLLVAGGVAFAASADDFREAVKNKGCKSIPYDGLRSTCIDRSEDVEGWCKGGRGTWKCDDLDPTGLQKQIENVKTKVEDLKHQREELAHQRDDAKDDDQRRALDDKLAEIDRKIDELQKKLDEWQHTLDDEKHAIADRVDVGKRCLEARKAVADQFAKAKSQAQNESDPEIKPLADQLVSYWESEEPNHANAIALVKAGVDKCDAMR